MKKLFDCEIPTILFLATLKGGAKETTGTKRVLQLYYTSNVKDWNGAAHDIT